jgi:hypothetical protein
VSANRETSGAQRNSTPTSIDNTPESRCRKNPLQARHENAPMVSATPPIKIDIPIAMDVASDAITTDPSAIEPRTTRATPHEHKPQPVAPERA